MKKNSKISENISLNEQITRVRQMMGFDDNLLSENSRLNRVRRRLYSHELMDELADILEEGLEFTNFCEYPRTQEGFQSFLDHVLDTSSLTFVLNYADPNLDDVDVDKDWIQFRQLVKKRIVDRYGRLLSKGFWSSNEDC